MSFQRTLGYDVYLLDDHSHMVYGEQRFFDRYGMNVGAAYDKWRPPEGVREYAHVRFFGHLFRFDAELSLTGWRRALPIQAPVNLLLTRTRLIEPSRDHQIHPFDFQALHGRYHLPPSMLYHFPRCGLNPTGDSRVPCRGANALRGAVSE